MAITETIDAEQKKFGETATAKPSGAVQVRVGGVYNSTLPTLSNGQDAELQVDSRGRVITAFDSSDIEIGAVEIKNSTDDTRATVGTNGLYVDVQNEPIPSTVINNQITVTTAGSRVQAHAGQAIKYAIISALSTNTGIIYVGNSTVSASNGYELQAGQSVGVAVNNLNLIYVDSSVSGEKVSYIAAN